MSNLKDTKLEIAKYSLNKVSSVLENTKVNSKKYKTLVKKVPVMIQKNGLMNTMAFTLSKMKDETSEHEEVLKQMIEWSKQSSRTVFRDQRRDDSNAEGYVEYMNRVFRLTSKEYRLLTQEMITLFSWMKRFADGLIEGEE